MQNTELKDSIKANKYILSTSVLTLFLTVIPKVFFEKQQVDSYLFDGMLLGIFIALTAALFYLSNIKKNKVLFRLIAVFIFFHLITFPLIYTYLLNEDSNNLRIEKDILDTEKSNQFDLIKETYGNANNENQKILRDIILDEKEFTKISQKQIEDNQMFILKNYIVVCSYRFQNGGNHPPTPVSTLNVYNKKGKCLLLVDANDKNLNLKNLFINALNEYKNLESKKYKAIRKTKVNKFWTYKSVLPYSINIFITGNLVPKSKLANTIYFIHNIFIFVGLLSIIIGIVQSLSSSKAIVKSEGK